MMAPVDRYEGFFATFCRAFWDRHKLGVVLKQKLGKRSWPSLLVAAKLKPPQVARGFSVLKCGEPVTAPLLPDLR